MQSQRIDNTVQLVQGLETFSPSSLLQNECSPSLSEYPSNHAQTFKTHNFWHLKSLVSLYDGGILFDPDCNCSYGQYRQQLSAGSLPLFVRSCSSCGISLLPRQGQERRACCDIGDQHRASLCSGSLSLHEIQCRYNLIPVVPHKAVAEVSKIGNL